MINVLFNIFDWLPSGLKMLFFCVVVLWIMPFFVDVVFKIITLFFRR